MTLYDTEQIVQLIYHYEDGSWWADSPSLPSLFAGGDTVAEAKELARQIVSEEIGDDVVIMEWLPVPGTLTVSVSKGTVPEKSVIEAWESHEAEVSPEWMLPAEPQPA